MSEDVILNYAQHVEDKINRLKRKHEVRESYSFTPDIDYRSRKIVEDKYEGRPLSPIEFRDNRFEALYGHSKSKEKKINQLSDQYYGRMSFQPALNDNTAVAGTFEERQENFKKRVQAKIE
jgi:hypothetical protein